jgi:hypothetical protein
LHTDPHFSSADKILSGMDPFSLGAMSGVIKEAGSAATAARALLGGRGAAEDAVPRFGLGVPETEREKCGNIDGRVQIFLGG